MSQITRIERRVSELSLENKGKEVSKRSRSSALVPAKKENFQLPERLQALLTDDFDTQEFQSKLELLKCMLKLLTTIFIHHLLKYPTNGVAPYR